MQECKNRAAGSLEWKDGDGDGERERFEKWADKKGFHGIYRPIALQGWEGAISSLPKNVDSKWEDAYRTWTDTHDLSIRRRMRQDMAFIKTFEKGWDMRQPEIDALKAEKQKIVFGSISLANELAELKGENEKLRNAAKPVIDYWFEGDETRTNEDHGNAFLELSNAYYRRVNTMTAPDTKGE